MSEQIKVKKEHTNNLWDQSVSYIDHINEDEAPQNFGGPLPSFKWMVESLLEKLSTITNDNHWYTNQSKRERKLFVVNQFIKEWRNTVGPNIYPVFALVLPIRDRERTYNIKDLKLGKYLLEILKIPKKSVDYEHIMNWKQFTKLPGQLRKQDNSQQKMSTVCVELLKKRKQDIPGGTLNIQDVNELLDELANNEAKKEEQMVLLKKAIDQMSFIELQYLFDIILKNRIDKGMENTLLYYWHPDAVDYLTVVSSLKLVCYKLSDPNKRLKKTELSINLGKPFKPQLSKKPVQNYNKIAEFLKNDFFIEEKMDGERIQVHYMDKGNEIHYYSRKAMDYTFIYGDNNQWGCISPHLQFIQAVKNCVLDGEMVTYDPQRKSFVPFGVLKGSAVQELKRLNSLRIVPNDDQTARPFLMVFDLLYLNDTPMTQYPLHKRKSILSNILKPKEGYVEIIDYIKASDEDAIKKALTHAVERGSEGIILKKHDSLYQLDKRIETWTKIKPEYLEEFGENVDLVVIGREPSKKDKYFCGLRVTNNDTADHKEPRFHSFCRVANGFDQDDYRKIDDLTKGKWKDMKTQIPPSNLIEFGKRLPVEWIDPRDSFVIEVKARSIDRSISKNYKTSTTLYNAYHRQIRTDKSWEDSTTLDEYMQIKEARKSTTDKEHKLLNRKKKQLINQLKKQSADEENWNDTVSSIKSNIFEDLTFMVLSDAFQDQQRLTTVEFSAILKQNGANITRNQHLVEDLSKLRVISDKRTIEAKELYRDGFDIIRSSWVYDCLKNKRLIKLEPKHCFDVSDTILKNSQGRVDAFDIGYLSRISAHDLSEIFKNTLKDDSINVKLEVQEGDAFKFEDVQRILMSGLLFDGLKIYLVSPDNKDQSVDSIVLKNQIEINGGTVVDSLVQSNLIVAPNYEDDSVIFEVQQVRKQLAQELQFHEETSVAKTKRVVNSDWIRDSIENRFRVDQQDYPVITPRV